MWSQIADFAKQLFMQSQETQKNKGDNENSPQQAAGYLQVGRPESRPSRVSAPERAEYAKTGNGASTGELHPESLKNCKEMSKNYLQLSSV